METAIEKIIVTVVKFCDYSRSEREKLLTWTPKQRTVKHCLLISKRQDTKFKNYKYRELEI